MAPPGFFASASIPSIGCSFPLTMAAIPSSTPIVSVLPKLPSAASIVPNTHLHVLVVLLAIPIVGVGAIEVDGEATVVETMAPLDLVGSRCLGLVFIMVPVSLGLVGVIFPWSF
ncbi:hypothetical protein H0E87_020614 [Populus deltoides]|uniref:Uncharacterized protein n=1 Tax=Populus deltoides TaxID=3696 RepID=A0A8T2XMF2_POPDE|nr:hypothetical protein H0E87_020614 [Populus deltoides]